MSQVSRTSFAKLLALLLIALSVDASKGLDDNANDTFGPDESLKSLVSLSVLFRHGDRTPDSLWPTYPNPEQVFKLHGQGDLTNVGKLREFNIGKALRRRYNHFLGELVEPNTVFALTTDFSRTKKSLLYLLASLYPPKSAQQWGGPLDWQAIPYEYVTPSQDKLFYGIGCIHSIALILKNRFSPAYQQKLDSYKNDFKYISNNTGLPINDVLLPMQIYLSLKSLESMNIPLPNWTKPVYPEKLRKMAIDGYKLATATDANLRYAAGFLMQDILEKMASQIKGTSVGRKVNLYSGHEVNIAFMLRLLNAFDEDVPNFGSYIVFELHATNPGYGIRIFHQNYVSASPKVLVIPGCVEICPIAMFVTLIEKRIPTSSDACKLIVAELPKI